MNTTTNQIYYASDEVMDKLRGDWLDEQRLDEQRLDEQRELDALRDELEEAGVRDTETAIRKLRQAEIRRVQHGRL